MLTSGCKDAEGNGDSIPAAVQADRIRRLREALAASLPPSFAPLQAASMEHLSQSPYVHMQRPAYDRDLKTSAFRTRDQTQFDVELGSRYNDPIYQTSTHSISSPYQVPAAFPIGSASGPFLPSCLQDIVQSPSLSPTSTTSADLSVDEYISSPAS